MSENLDKLRNEINAVDEKIITLFNQRMDIVSAIAIEKNTLQIGIANQAREDEVLRHVKELSKEEYSNVLQMTYQNHMQLSSLFQEQKRIISNNVKNIFKIENSLEINKVGYFGKPGSNTHIATQALYPKVIHIPESSIFDTVSSLMSGQYDTIVLPIENSTAGSVENVFDLILNNDLFIIKCIRMPIKHCLLTKSENIDIKKIHTIFSHEQALRQCFAFLSKSFPNAKLVPFASTSEAALYLKESEDENIAVIASLECARLYDLYIAAQDIQTVNGNMTRFVSLSKTCQALGNVNKFSVSFLLPHKPGSLSDILNLFKIYQLNLTKIESCPDQSCNFEYRFFIDVQGDITNELTKNFITLLYDRVIDFKFIGAYAENE